MHATTRTSSVLLFASALFIASILNTDGILAASNNLYRCDKLSRPSWSIDADAKDTDAAAAAGKSGPIRVAIIGAGIAGSSAAYYLNNPQLLSLQNGTSAGPIAVDIYEKNNEPGGRVTSRLFYNGDPEDNDGDSIPNQTGVDLGASLFVGANYNLMSLSTALGLERNSHPLVDLRMSSVDGLWNGQTLAYAIDDGSIWDPKTWMKHPEIATRYGGIATLTERFYPAVAAFLKQFNTIYNHHGQWSNVADVVEKLGMKDLALTTFYDHLTGQLGMPSLFVDELISALTRNNYGLDARSIHAVAGFISCIPIIDKVYDIKGGNQKLVKTLVDASKARIFLSTPVNQIERRRFGRCNNSEYSNAMSYSMRPEADPSRLAQSLKSCRPIWGVTTQGGAYREYDAIILAAPFFQMDVATKANTFADLPDIGYKSLSVTLTTGKLNPRYLKPSPAKMPTTLWVSSSPLLLSQSAITYVDSPANGRTLTKHFSDEQLSDSELARLFVEFDSRTVHRQQWLSYPLMIPASYDWNERGQTAIAAAAWYVNAMEPFVSTMETETISAKNIAFKVHQWFNMMKTATA
ncbi:Prenylcysteine lyase-domain-containing protein [Syncephalis fuscata]|nr:Prenylcysteine lyase-domain-containing protein [Syncephalis fuscata]